MNPHKAAKVYVSTVTVTWVFVVGLLTLATESCAAFDRHERLLKTEQRGPGPAHPPVPGPTLHTYSLQDLATSAAHLCGVPSKLFHKLIDRESTWRVHAVSSSGALGLAQIKPSTLRGVSPTLRPWVPSDRLIGAACYLRQMYDREDAGKGERARWRAALLSYRYGPNRKRTPSTKYADLILEVRP